MSAVFVTGTGTDIGKTWVTAAMLRFLRSQGVTATALKPVVSGYDPRDASASDPAMLLAAMNLRLSEDNINAISPFRFAAPLAPDMAARREGKTLHLDAIVDFCRAEIASASSAMLIEGVGGIMSPVAEGATGLDLMRALQCPTLLVAGSYLGAISHALTAIEAIVHAGIALRAIVINETMHSGVSLDETREELARFVGDTVIIAIGRSMAQQDASLRAIARACAFIS